LSRLLSRREAIALGAGALAATASGCGYALAGRGTFLPSYIRTVGIPQIENRTTFYRVEQVLTEKVRAEFIGRGKYKVVPDTTGADAMLTAEIASITVQPVGLTETQLASRYLFTVAMKAQFTDVRTTEVLWSNDQLIFREEYDLGTRSNTAIQGDTFLDTEATSFDRISTDIARTVVTAIVEAF
jgi:hypothetical protein